MRRTFSAAAAIAATFSIANAASPQCDTSDKCPQDQPCCSQYGQCGVGAYCLGGCDPLSSFNLESCMPAPTCESKDFQLTSLDSVEANSDYLGDASQVDWVSSGTPVAYNNEAVLLTMAPNTVGTLLMSAHYVWYGKVSTTMTTSQGSGVITAFVMMSDVKDEIDFEFVGVDLEAAQTNYYFQGITNYENGENATVSNTQMNTHTYEIDWQPEQITWSIDGQEVRTLTKESTYNDTDKRYHYPQTPSRVQLSLWPAGLPSNAEGTIQWGGGLVDWNSEYMQNGYYYAMIKEVTIECYDPPSGSSSDKSFTFSDDEGLESSVKSGNKGTVLASLLATGNHPNRDNNQESKPDVETVPGISGSGERSIASNRESSSNSSSASASGGSSGFSQGSDSTNEASTVMAGSAVALLGFFVAALML